MRELLETLLKTGLEDGCYCGAAAACGRGDTVYAKAVCGKTALDGETVNECTLWDMASLTKVLAPTMLAFLAIDSGHLALWDEVGAWFEFAPEDKKHISIFHLMTHTSGIVPGFRLDKGPYAPKDAARAVLESELLHSPGGEPAYSCMGYILLGKLLEKLYGGGLDTLSKQLVFEPLGMKHTGYLPKGTNIAATEVDPVSGKAWKGIVHDENARYLGGVSGNAGVFSDLGDMITFAEFLSGGCRDFISPVLFKKAIANYTPAYDAHRGLGFHLGGSEYSYAGDLFPACSFGHTGFTGTSLVVDPTTGFWAVLLSNRVHPTRENLRLMGFRRRFHNALYARFSKDNP